MRALILGAGGAIGSAMTRYLIRNRIECHAVVRSSTRRARLASVAPEVLHECDIADSRVLGDLIRRLNPDLVITAAFPSGHAETDDARRRMLAGMTNGILGLFTALRDTSFHGRLVLVGSASCYGKGGHPRHATDALRPQTFRGAVKAAERTLAAQLAAELDIALTEIRVFTGFGPFEQRERLVPQLLHAALAGTRVRLTGQPFQRDWIYYDDIARSCLAAAAQRTRTPVVHNACSSTLTSTHRVAAILEGIAGRSLVADEPFEGVDRYGDAEPGVLSSAFEGFEWKPTLSLEEGLEICWKWALSPAGSAYLLQADASKA